MSLSDEVGTCQQDAPAASGQTTVDPPEDPFSLFATSQHDGPEQRSEDGVTNWVLVADD